MEIKLSKETVDRCKQFAAECAPTNVNRYKFRNQSNLKQIERQIFVGKIGECAAHQFLRDHGIEPDREPDFEIYKTKKKSWDSDMKCNGVPIHIKSQEMYSAKRYGHSWLFQLSSSRPNGEDYDELLKTPDGILIFCTVDDTSVIIQFAGESSTCIPSLLKEPVVHQLRSYKRAIYLEDLQKKFKDKMISLEVLQSDESSNSGRDSTVHS